MLSKHWKICATVSTQRSGTKLLGNCFNQGTAILSLGEVFHEQAESALSFRRFVQRNPQESLHKLISGASFNLLDEYLEELSSLPRTVHVDIMYGNLMFCTPLWWNYPARLAFLHYLRTRKIPIIHLVRDVVDTYSSMVNAKLTGQYHVSKNGTDITEPGAARLASFDEAALMSEFEDYRMSTLGFRTRVRAALEGYPLGCEIAYDTMLNEGSDELSPSAKTKIASIFPDGRISVADIQCGATTFAKTAAKHPQMSALTEKLRAKESARTGT